jgi:putative thiamine transport system permease protein
MAATLRRLRPHLGAPGAAVWGAAVLLAALALPLGWSLLAAVQAGLDTRAWAALAQDPQTLPALRMSLASGLLATLLATLGTATILSSCFAGRSWHGLQKRLAPMLAVPHAAMAIGLVALLAPSGWLLRTVSPWLTGLHEPPPWPTTQDPWGLGLVAVLVLKEIAFLLWAAMAYMQRPDSARRLRQELQVASSLGYSDTAAWWRVVWPQLMPVLAAPLLAVLAYSLSVVDVALIIGPTSPPTLAVLAWQWLLDADPATNAQGAAAAWLLAAALAACAVLVWLGARARWWRLLWTAGWQARWKLRQNPARAPAGALLRLALPALYVAVLAALALGSFTAFWPFPRLLPQQWTLAAWRAVADSSSALSTTLWLGLASSACALLWSLAWLEWAPAAWQRRIQHGLYLPLALPAVLWVLGLHRLALAWGLDGQAPGLLLVHTLACLPYVLLALNGPYAAFDVRLRQVSDSLGHGHWTFLYRVKWPLLKAALVSAFAIGFSVSVAQYLPTLYIGAGRFITVTSEAVNLAAGAQRSLLAAFAALQWLLPATLFALAALLARPRHFHSGTRRQGKLLTA